MNPFESNLIQELSDAEKAAAEIEARRIKLSDFENNPAFTPTEISTDLARCKEMESLIQE